jgi:hypothetical protein
MEALSFSFFRQSDGRTKRISPSVLSAYHDYEKGKLQVALANDEYNPEKHKNDLLDAEQLIYLFDATLCFLTCDKGVSNFVKKSSQASRVITVSPNDLNNAASAEKVLRGIVRSNPSKGVASNGSGPER